MLIEFFQVFISRQLEQARIAFNKQNFVQAGLISKEILHYHGNSSGSVLSESQKTQLARYLWKSGEWRLEWLPLFSVDKMTHLEICDVLSHYKLTWTQQNEEYTQTLTLSSPIKHLCFFLEKFFLIDELKPENDMELLRGSNFCHIHMMHKQSLTILTHAMKIIGNSTYADRKRLETVRSNLGIDLSHSGDFDEGSKLLVESLENTLNEFQKLFFNPSGKDPPYQVMIIDRLPSDYHKTLIANAMQERITVNSPQIESSPLGAPSVTEYFDRDTHLVHIKQVYQEGNGLFRLYDNGFIFYDDAFAAVRTYEQKVKTQTQFSVERVEHGVFLGAYLHNYYHWAVEAMSRLVYLMEIGFFSQNKDAILVLHRRVPLIEDSLRMIDFPKERVKYVNFEQEQVYFDNLYGVVSLPWENPQSAVRPSMQQLPACTLLQRLNRVYNPNPLPLVERRKIVYVGRATASVRKTRFDPQLTAKLKSIFGKDFYVVQAAPATLEEQKKLFTQARIIVGPHGAGLSNLIFTVPNQTAIIEFPVVTKLNSRVFSYLSGCLDMYHWVVPSMLGLHNGFYDSSPQLMEDVANAVISVANYMKTLE